MNTASGGLVANCAAKCYVTDVKDYSGTYILDLFGNVLGKTENLMWYSAVYGKDIYYSNQKDNNYLYVMDNNTGASYRIAEIPCKNLLIVGDYLYFIDENQGGIKCYIIPRREVYKVCEVNADCFVIYGNSIFYSTQGGIGEYNIQSRTERTILQSVAGGLEVMGNILVFNDYKEQCAITVFDCTKGTKLKIDAVRSTSFTVNDRYIYAVNECDNNSLTRIDVFKGELMRIYGESISSLHAADNNLYFLDRDREWCKMSCSGESFTKLRI